MHKPVFNGIPSSAETITGFVERVRRDYPSVATLAFEVCHYDQLVVWMRSMNFQATQSDLCNLAQKDGVDVSAIGYDVLARAYSTDLLLDALEDFIAWFDAEYLHKQVLIQKPGSRA